MEGARVAKEVVLSSLAAFFFFLTNKHSIFIRGPSN